MCVGLSDVRWLLQSYQSLYEVRCGCLWLLYASEECSGMCVCCVCSVQGQLEEVERCESFLDNRNQ